MTEQDSNSAFSEVIKNITCWSAELKQLYRQGAGEEGDDSCQMGFLEKQALPVGEATATSQGLPADSNTAMPCIASVQLAAVQGEQCYFFKRHQNMEKGDLLSVKQKLEDEQCASDLKQKHLQEMLSAAQQEQRKLKEEVRCLKSQLTDEKLVTEILTDSLRMEQQRAAKCRAHLNTERARATALEDELVLERITNQKLRAEVKGQGAEQLKVSQQEIELSISERDDKKNEVNQNCDQPPNEQHLECGNGPNTELQQITGKLSEVSQDLEKKRALASELKEALDQERQQFAKFVREVKEELEPAHEKIVDSYRAYILELQEELKKERSRVGQLVLQLEQLERKGGVTEIRAPEAQGEEQPSEGILGVKRLGESPEQSAKTAQGDQRRPQQQELLGARESKVNTIPAQVQQTTHSGVLEQTSRLLECGCGCSTELGQIQGRLSEVSQHLEEERSLTVKLSEALRRKCQQFDRFTQEVRDEIGPAQERIVSSYKAYILELQEELKKERSRVGQLVVQQEQLQRRGGLTEQQQESAAQASRQEAWKDNESTNGIQLSLEKMRAEVQHMAQVLEQWQLEARLQGRLPQHNSPALQSTDTKRAEMAQADQRQPYHGGLKETGQGKATRFQMQERQSVHGDCQLQNKKHAKWNNDPNADLQQITGQLFEVSQDLGKERALQSNLNEALDQERQQLAKEEVTHEKIIDSYRTFILELQEELKKERSRAGQLVTEIRVPEAQCNCQEAQRQTLAAGKIWGTRGERGKAQRGPQNLEEEWEQPAVRLPGKTIELITPVLQRGETDKGEQKHPYYQEAQGAADRKEIKAQVSVVQASSVTDGDQVTKITSEAWLKALPVEER
ncbi:trichohyalin-like [Lepisosteus oculatus]|uniref:trichohyalin-like n=1 Tax=Lepisosteus oculatus TaxID=7918 RepID=UPI0035F51F86